MPSKRSKKAPQPQPAARLDLRSAEYGILYSTVPDNAGTDGIPEGLHPLPQVFFGLCRKPSQRLGLLLRRICSHRRSPVLWTRKPATARWSIRSYGFRVETPTDMHRVSIYNHYARDWYTMDLDGSIALFTDITAIPPKGPPKQYHRRAGGHS